MRYYTYKKTKKLHGTIVLLTTVNDEYIGLAHREKFYTIKSNDLIEIYNFIVCIPEGEYLIPIGYSNKNEWILQEEEYKNLNPSNLSEIIHICKNIKDEWGHLCWKNINTMFNEKLEDLEEIKDTVINNFMLYRVVKRCYEKKFPIQEYVISQIPYGDNDYWMINFINAKDLNNYNIKKDNTKIREIDFVVEKRGQTIHHRYNHRNSKLYESNNCKRAVWI